MAYGVKYIMQFTSDRGNEIRIEVLKKDYQGEVIYKSLGGSPSLSIEQGDAAVKGSSLVFAMQADTEGELQELYTTDNKLFKVNMYRNEVLSWQGYILPELYSEEYVDAPYDVSVTATDQLATLKAITYQREDVNVSISTMIEDILSFTQVPLPVTYHQNLSAVRKGEVPMLVDSHISQAAYNGYSCYDVLNNILLSCNCCIMQINGEWLITSLTNSTTNYYTAGVNVVREHKILGQLGVGEVCPAGTLTMVNNPALKGAKVEYAHMLRNSFLVNADCVDREGWNYTPDSRNPIDIPGEREAFGKIFKAYCWELHPVNIREDNSLQLWQEVSLEKDERNYYDLSVKTLFGTNAKLLLMAVTYLGSDGIERRLTSEGWIETWDKSDVNYYIQITGTNKNAGLDAIADIEQYEMSTVQFALPPVDGTMRVGFINSTTDYAEPLASAPIYVSQVYLTVSGVTGQECTTEVEPNATQEQQDVLLAYGDTFESENAYKLGLNTLKKSSGENITSWWLDNINFSSYYDTMLQEFSRYFGVKKAQLQGIIMGKDVLSDMYADVFSGRVMRLLSAQVDLLADEASVTVEEVITTTVDFDTVIYATNNTNSFGSSSGGGAGTSGGASSTAGESLLGVQSDGDVYVKDGRALVGQEGRFENLALPVDAPTERKETRTYLYSSDPSKGAIDIAKIAKWIDEQEEMWVLDAENGVIKTTYNVVSEGEMMALRRASGSGSGGGGTTQITAQMITDALGYVPYSSLNPAGYITSAAIPAALKNPYALTINGVTYDGSEAVGITISGGGGVADSVDWANVANKPNFATVATSGNYSDLSGVPTSLPASDVYDWAKAASKPSYAFSEITGKPTTLGGYGITDALSTSGGELQGTTDTPLYLNGTDGSYIGFRNSAKSILGYFGFDSAQTPKVHIGYNYQYDIIHSGNIGSQTTLKACYILTPYTYEGGNYISDATTAETIIPDSLAFPAMMQNTAWCGGWSTTFTLTGYKQYGGSQLSIEYNASTPRAALRNYNQSISGWTNWREIAFLDSNVASATKLQTARTIWGQSFDGTGDISGKLTGASYIETLEYGVGNASFALGSSYSGLLLSAPSGNIYHRVGDNNAMTITSGGNVLIGATSDNGNKLQVNGDISAMGGISSSLRYVVTAAYDATNPTEQAIVINSANYASTYAAWPGIGFHIPGSTYGTIKYGSDDVFHFMNATLSGWVDVKVGNLVATGEVISLRRASSSDARLKDNINRLIAEDCLEIVRNLQPSSWQWKEDGKFSLGFIAQDIEPLMPYAVTRIKDDVLGQRLNLQYDQFFAPVVGAIQCLDREVEQLKKRVKYLENKLQEYGNNRY